jgi:hypothetical protein
VRDRGVPSGDSDIDVDRRYTMTHKDPRTPLKRHLNMAKDKLQKAMAFYEKLEEGVPKDRHWTLKQASEMDHTVHNLVRHNPELPTAILAEAIHALDEYIVALDNMSEDQVSAFFLGLGLRCVDLPYWGRSRALRNLTAIGKTRTFYKRLEKAVPAEEKWKVEKEEQFLPLSRLVPRARKIPTELLEEYHELLEAQLTALEHWSFA